MKNCTSVKQLLRETDNGKRAIVLPCEEDLNEIRAKHYEIYDGLKSFSLTPPKGGIHLIIVQAKNPSTYKQLKVLLAGKDYKLLGLKGQLLDPSSIPTAS